MKQVIFISDTPLFICLVLLLGYDLLYLIHRTSFNSQPSNCLPIFRKIVLITISTNAGRLKKRNIRKEADIRKVFINLRTATSRA